jgi:hypothetical protein
MCKKTKLSLDGVLQHCILDRMDAALYRLRQKYQDEIRTKEDELKALRAKFAVIEEIDAEARNLDLNLGSTKYAGKGLTDAIIAAVEELGQGHTGATAGQIHKHIVANGFQTTGANTPVSVITTLKRLAKSGRVLLVIVNGKRHYRPKNLKNGMGAEAASLKTVNYAA